MGKGEEISEVDSSMLAVQLLDERKVQQSCGIASASCKARETVLVAVIKYNWFSHFRPMETTPIATKIIDFDRLETDDSGEAVRHAPLFVCLFFVSFFLRATRSKWIILVGVLYFKHSHVYI